VGSDILCSAFPEGNNLGCLEQHLPSTSATGLNGVNTIVPLFPAFSGSVPRFGEADGVEWPQSHPARAAIQHVAVNPVFRSVGCDA
jgi:hypothetical protein